MNQFIRRIHSYMNKRNWRKLPYIEAQGMFFTKLFYEDIQ